MRGNGTWNPQTGSGMFQAYPKSSSGSGIQRLLLRRRQPPPPSPEDYISLVYLSQNVRSRAATTKATTHQNQWRPRGTGLLPPNSRLTKSL
jgi:hypothetical protein